MGNEASAGTNQAKKQSANPTCHQSCAGYGETIRANWNNLIVCNIDNVNKARFDGDELLTQSACQFLTLAWIGVQNRDLKGTLRSVYSLNSDMARAHLGGRERRE